MKRLSVLLAISMLLLLTACSGTVSGKKIDKGSNKTGTAKTMEKKDLTLQVAKVDKENGLTIENSQIYQWANDVIKEKPELGGDNTFTMYLVDSLTKESEEKMLLFMAINRIKKTIKNITFDLTAGNETGGYVCNPLKVSLLAATIGVPSAE